MWRSRPATSLFPVSISMFDVDLFHPVFSLVMQFPVYLYSVSVATRTSYNMIEYSVSYTAAYMYMYLASDTYVG